MKEGLLSIDSPENQGELTRVAAKYFCEPMEAIDVSFHRGNWQVTVTSSTGEFFDDPVTYNPFYTIGGMTVGGVAFKEAA